MCSATDKSNNKKGLDDPCLWTNEKSTPFQTVTGGAALSTFLMTWFASLGSPFLTVFCIYNGLYTPIYFLLAATTIAYLPWKKGFVSGLVSDFARYNNYYYEKCSVLYKSKASLPLPGKEQRPALYAVHPHGAFCMGWSVLFCSKVMNEGRVRFCFSPVLYASPLFRLWCRLVGRPGSAAKDSMIGYMRNKSTSTGRPDHLALPPGGFEEATLSGMEKDRAYIKKRMGFVKLALQNGYNVVPVYSFGENKTYWNMQGLWKLRLWLNGLGFPAIVVFGSWFMPLLPKRHERGLRVVVGEPIVLPTIETPSREEVKSWHDKYVAALTRLFEEHKEDYYGPELAKTAKLELW
mmetsp:Transcript_22424/g.47364  ORF Transcript_22424/g.47364 Transcript_22424/m.47364 type:complete len:349 (-) Transcript_22424:1912-2958(-)|eukprot:CAMPEP_0201118824 /NCGR_PEP_ID=MMETSP0850-20130426/3005_1 /ASSEMBLY_ACC=CAM_ASM_000622 /TAXON_ID=183588 /ORGANISM="Pseudo-nitzschia fraudulenta, Strain WWA7" /LENGTH=348 /DNA_ID=CAMNT_0047384261 /DNA_START=113 /DNA_END=1159 /DNA_ORIENTATION=-